MTDLTLTTSRTIAAPPERVFKAWLDPKMLAKFMRPAEGMEGPKASTDPREGGRFDIVMKAGDQEIPHSGTYKLIKPHSQLVFTWESPMSIDGSTVTLDFTPVAGGTLVKLHHVKFPSEESRNNHESGWARILATLGEVA